MTFLVSFFPQSHFPHSNLMSYFRSFSIHGTNFPDCSDQKVEIFFSLSLRIASIKKSLRAGVTSTLSRESWMFSFT